MAAFCTSHDRTEGYSCWSQSPVPCQKPNGYSREIVLETHHARQHVQHVQLGMYKLDLYRNRMIECSVNTSLVIHTMSNRWYRGSKSLMVVACHCGPPRNRQRWNGWKQNTFPSILQCLILPIQVQTIYVNVYIKSIVFRIKTYRYS